MKLSLSFIAHTIKSYYIEHESTSTLVGKISDGSGLKDFDPIMTSGEIDTIGREARDIVPGSMYWPLRTKKTNENERFFDGFHSDVARDGDIIAAINKGARYLVLEHSELSFIEKLAADKKIPDGVSIIFLDRSDESLIAVARAWRANFSIPVIGITGSIGKTTTKEMLRSIFETADLDMFVSHENQNKLHGLALNMLQLTGSHKAAVFEVGISHKGEMEQLADLLAPTMGVITTISHSHTKQLGNLGSVTYEKKKLFANFLPSQIGIVCGDNSNLADGYYHHPVVRFGLKGRNNITAKKISTVLDRYGNLETEGKLVIYNDTVPLKIHGHHTSLIYAALAASAVSYFLQIPSDVIAQGITNFVPVSGRFNAMDIVKKRGIVVDDAYNANPESMKAALVAFEQMSHYKNKIAVLGDMLDLGEKEAFWHRQIGREIRKTKSIKRLILIGERAKKIAETVPFTVDVHYAQDLEQVPDMIYDMITDDPGMVLVKGAHEMDFSRIVEALAT